MDRRSTPANARVAAARLRGVVTAARYVEGEARCICVPLTTLRATPDGAIDRQLLLGAEVLVYEDHQGWSLIESTRDGYCGYIETAALGAAVAATHWVAVRATHLRTEPKVRVEPHAMLSFGARVTVDRIEGRYARTAQGWIPLPHLLPAGQVMGDPVAAAEILLGTPYYWGGNSSAGIDCSGMVHAALHACGFACPGDADQQSRAVGRPLAADEAPMRGDLAFWPGHVAMVADGGRFIHANAYAMAVAHEPLQETIDRIAAEGSGQPAFRRFLHVN